MGRVTNAYREQVGPHSKDLRLAALAARQHGTVSAGQLQAIGYTHAAVGRRVQQGRLHRLYRGVYAVGHAALTLEARQLAAVMACGPDAALSHRSAGLRLGIVRTAIRIEVSAPRSRGARKGVTVHRTHALAPADRDIRDGIPITSPARTLVDLADVLNERRLADALHQAEVLRIFDLAAITEALERVPGRSGRHRLTQAIAAYQPDPPLLRNEAEKRFLDLVEAHGLPTPHTNVPLGGFELDFYWADARLAVEVDGGAVHHTQRAFQEDRRRDRELAAMHGIQSLRVTWRDLDRPAHLAGQLRQTLARRAR